jgi:hypothetical protein
VIRRRLVAGIILGGLLAAACAGGTEEPRSADSADTAQAPMDRLKAIPRDLKAEVAAITGAVDDIDSVIDQITGIPGRYGLDAGRVVAMAKAALATGKVSVKASADVGEEAQAEIASALKKLTKAVAALKAAPLRVAALVVKLPKVAAQVVVLATQVTATATVTMSNPFSSDEAKLDAKADLENVKKVQTDVMELVKETQTKIVGLPARASGALGKLAASFAGGTEDEDPSRVAAGDEEDAVVTSGLEEPSPRDPPSDRGASPTGRSRPSAPSKKATHPEVRVSLDEPQFRDDAALPEPASNHPPFPPAPSTSAKKVPATTGRRGSGNPDAAGQIAGGTLVPSLENGSVVCSLGAPFGPRSPPAWCLGFAMGPIVITDLHASGACPADMVVLGGDPSAARWLVQSPARAPLHVTGARLFARRGESVSIAILKPAAVNVDVRCAITWSGQSPAALGPERGSLP